jgi:hypothetical protein
MLWLIVLSGGLRFPLAVTLAGAAVSALAQTSARPGSTSINLLILPKEPSGTLPEYYAAQAAKLRLMSMERVQPILQREVKWPESGRIIRLIGIRGERPLRGGDSQVVLDPVPGGSIALGYSLHRSTGYKPGDLMELLGRKFTVARCEPARDEDDERTAWIHLSEAQELFQQPGRISGIVILNAHATSDRLGRIRAEVAGRLPETRVIEFGTETLAQAEARDRQAQPAPKDLSSGLWKITLAGLLAIGLVSGSLWIAFRVVRLRHR